MSGTTISAGEGLAAGWRWFKARPWFWVGLVVVATLAQLAVNQLAAVLLTGSAAGEPPSGLAGLLAFAIGLMVSTWLSLVMIGFAVASVDGGRPRFDLLSFPRHRYWRFLGTTFLLSLLCGIGFALLVLPGLYLAARFLPTAFVAADRDVGVLEALAVAQRLTEGQRWELFLYVLLGVILLFAAIIPFGLGILVVVPVLLLGSAHLYRRMEGRPAPR